MSKRKPGERIWDENAQEFILHTAVPDKSPTRKSHSKKLRVEELSLSPPSFLVYDKHGNEWHIVVATDGEPEVLSRSSDAYPNVEGHVLRAIRRRLKND